MISVRDVTDESIDDAFRVCSFSKLDDSLQRQGMELKRRWMLRMIREYGSCTKVAYLGDRPVAQLLFYPETAIPFIPEPRRGALLLRCVYNPFEEAQGKGAAKAIVQNLIDECRHQPAFLKGEECSFIASEAFNTGEGTQMEKFYARNGFERRGEEMVLTINGPYAEPKVLSYVSSDEDAGKAVAFYNPTCEYSYASAVRLKKLLKELYPSLPIELMDQWEKPTESMKRGNRWLVVNSVQIESSWHERETLLRDIKRAVERGPGR